MLYHIVHGHTTFTVCTLHHMISHTVPTWYCSSYHKIAVLSYISHIVPRSISRTSYIRTIYHISYFIPGMYQISHIVPFMIVSHIVYTSCHIYISYLLSHITRSRSYIGIIVSYIVLYANGITYRTFVAYLFITYRTCYHISYVPLPGDRVQGVVDVGGRGGGRVSWRPSLEAVHVFSFHRVSSWLLQQQ